MAQRRHNTGTVTDQMRTLRDENRKQAKTLSAELRSFYEDCETYFLTSAPAQLPIYQELSKLIERLQVAELRQISAEAVLGMSGEDYCKLTLRRMNIERYDFSLSRYVPSVVTFLLLTLTIYATYMFIAGFAWWGDFASAIQMPVQISALGLPLQVFLIFTSIFFWVQFRRNTSFGRKWYQDFNSLYLFAGIFATILIFVLPYIIHTYQVVQFPLPVWLIWLFAIIGLGYYLLTEYFDVGDKMDQWISSRASRGNGDMSYAPSLDSYTTGLTDEDDKDLTPVRELDQTPDENDPSPVSDEPMRLNNLWNTIKLKRPIINRKTYREMQERQEREEKDDNEKSSSRKK